MNIKKILTILLIGLVGSLMLNGVSATKDIKCGLGDEDNQGTSLHQNEISSMTSNPMLFSRDLPQVGIKIFVDPHKHLPVIQKILEILMKIKKVQN